MRVREFMELQNEELAADMEVYDKLDDAVDNYLNMAALYGFENDEAKACLYRGIRNAFLLGKSYEYERFKMMIGVE